MSLLEHRNFYSHRRIMMRSQPPRSPPLNTEQAANNASNRGDGLGRSHSIQQTPAEYHGPEFPPNQGQQARKPSDDLPHIVESPSSPEASNNSPNPNHGNGHWASSHAPATSADWSPPPRSPEPIAYTPNVASPPPLSEHPANFAPYADPSPMTPNPPAQPVPSKPAPTSSQPIHTTHTAAMTVPDEQQRREKEWSVVPDDNPLASSTSTSPYIPSTTFPSHQDTNQSIDHRPGQITHPSQKILGGMWSHSLCDCSDFGVCCMGFWCPCILYGRTQYRLSMKSDRKDPTNLLGYETCNAPCTGMALLCGFQWLLATVQHVRTRRAYGITGGVASDCVRATCCTCCTLIQDEREIRLREESARNGGIPGSTVPYTSPTNMAFSPPPK